MKKRILYVLAVLGLGLFLQAGDLVSLSHLFTLGKGLADADGDSLADGLSFRIVIPDNPTPQEIAVAADIAGRANLESLAVVFDLLVRESDLTRLKGVDNLILIGSRLRLVQELLGSGRTAARPGSREAVVFSFSRAGRKGLALAAGSEDVLLKAGRAFFLRWPYLWEIWGREEGATYPSLEKDVQAFFEKEGARAEEILVRSALYEFPAEVPLHETLKKLQFAAGEIKSLRIEVAFRTREDRDKAARALTRLSEERRSGVRTEVLSYPGCRLLDFVLDPDGPGPSVAVARTGYAKRFLTPGYKTPAKPETAGKEFDLIAMFTTKGFLADSDGDGLADNVSTSIILSPATAPPALDQLTSRLALLAAGGSFPLALFDTEVENAKSLTAPIVIAPNSLSEELVKQGKLKSPPLEPGQGLAVVIPEAFHKSSALVLAGADAAGLDGLLRYLGRTFPYFKEFRKGAPQAGDVLADVERFLAGESGAAESFFWPHLKRLVLDLKAKDLEYLSAEFVLPDENPGYIKEVQALLESSLHPKKVEVKNTARRAGKVVFEKDSTFPWEGDDLLAKLDRTLQTLGEAPSSLRVDAGVSESPAVRRSLEERIEALLGRRGVRDAKVRVHSAYKPGFYWLLEDILPALKGLGLDRLVIRWPVEPDDLMRPKRFYAEPTRWLKELYPVDDLLAGPLGLPLDKILFEAVENANSTYEALALGRDGKVLLRESFAVRTKVMPYLKPMPEWGPVKICTGWLKLETWNAVLLDAPLETDLEKFWRYYQDEALSPLLAHILKKTSNQPTFSKQPYFKKLGIELWASEPDYRLGLDEEIVSSLEAMHDEVYFDTLDFLRGITEIDTAEESTPEDTSRYSAPGNVLPLIHASREGAAAQTKITLEDWPAPTPQLDLKWKERGHEENSRKVTYLAVKPKGLTVPSLIYSTREKAVENIVVRVDLDKEDAYAQLIDMAQSFRELQPKGCLPQGFRFPRLRSLSLRLKVKDLEKEERLPVLQPAEPLEVRPATAPTSPGSTSVPNAVLSPEMVWEIVNSLGRSQALQAYSAGRSYENREIPVLEVFAPRSTYVSVPRLITFKPTLYLSGRQHANEISSTNSILKLADLLAHDPAFAEYIKRMNVVLHPMENPDGAALAYELQKITPFHSLHAGRYSSLGMELGYQVDAARPLLPEARVRREIMSSWIPDIYLNLHGYPSHEWVQAFSNYSPFLFRDYWVPKGWFAYFRAVTSAFYPKWKEATERLREILVARMQADPGVREANARLSDRFYRWAARWQPHLDTLELYDGLNLYIKRKASQETKLDSRTRMTYIEETPEVMDETASGEWLGFLTGQGLAYLKAHIEFLARTTFDILRLEEEVSDRVRIQFFRSRPGTTRERPSR